MFFKIWVNITLVSYKSKATKAIDAKLMLGHRIVSADITNSTDAKNYAKAKKAEMEKAIQEHNTAIRTVKHFESKVKHINEIQSV